MILKLSGNDKKTKKLPSVLNEIALGTLIFIQN